MANRHRAQKKNVGGAVAYNAANSNVVREAKEKAGGGKVVGKACGGPVAPMRMDKRARGGRIGSDKSPFAPGAAKHPFSSAGK